VKAACVNSGFRGFSGMESSSRPVTLTPEQIGELIEKLSNLRHEINNNLSLMTAASELVRYKPQMLERMLNTVAQQCPRITESIATFSAEFEKALGITRT
jgi:hypothetical protein